MAIDANRIRNECVYRAQAPIAALLGDLAEIEKLTRTEQAFRKTLRWTSLALFLAGIVLAFFQPPVLALAIPGALGIFIYSFFYARGLLGHPAREQFVKDLLITLQQDTSAKAPYNVDVALKNREQKISEEPWTQRKNGKQQFLKDEWLSLAGELLDGTQFSETVTDLIRKRTFVNSNNKTKTKTRTRSLVELKLSYPRGLYGDAGAVFGSLRDPLKVPSTVKIKSVQAGGKAISLKAVVNAEKDLKQANAMLFLGAYRILNLSRQVAAKGGAR